MNQELQELVRYRLERARQTLVEAQALAEIESWNGALNRLYYACFYATNALLAAHGLSSPKHTGVRSLFNRHFIANSKLSREMGTLYNELFLHRQQGDYEDYRQATEADVIPYLPRSEAFIARIETLLAPDTSSSGV